MPEKTEESIDAIITLTEKAATMIKQVALGENCPAEIRVGVRGGGCSGFQYDLHFKKDDPANGKFIGDFEYEQEGVKIYIDPISAIHLEGTIIDYVNLSIAGEGFKFINPRAKRTCGCGSSFETEKEE